MALTSNQCSSTKSPPTRCYLYEDQVTLQEHSHSCTSIHSCWDVSLWSPVPLEELAEVSLVMLNDHPTQREPLAAVEREIKDKGRQAVIHLADVSLETDVQAMVTETGKRLGSLDVVAHFYFTTRQMQGLLAIPWQWVMRLWLFLLFQISLWTASVEDFHRLYSINALGTYLCYKYAAKQKIERGRGGRIIGASSVAIKQGKPSYHKVGNINHRLFLRLALPQLIFVYKVCNPRICSDDWYPPVCRSTIIADHPVSCLAKSDRA